MRRIEDDYFLQLAYQEAQKAFLKNEVPVGAVLINPQKKIVSKAHNLKECHHDGMAHAEILALRKVMKKEKKWRLDGYTLYSTLEPCPMCAGALLHARIERLVFGALDFKWGAVQSRINLLTPGLFNHTLNVEYLPLTDCSDILTAFFKQVREKK